MASELITPHVEQVRSRKRPGSVRYWRDAERTELVSAICRGCGELIPAAGLVRDAKRPGGRALTCLADKRTATTARRSDPAVREAERAYNATPTRRAAEAARLRRRMARLSTRTDAEIAADRERLHPSGRKPCHTCREDLPLDAYPSNITTANGLGRNCRPCDVRARVRRTDRARADLLAELDDARDLNGCWYTGYAFTPSDDMELEHVINKASFEPGDADPDDPLNLRPALASVNRGPGGKHEKAPLDYIEELYPGILDLLGGWPCTVVELRPREVAA